MESGKLYCDKCHKVMGSEQFYSSNNIQKYPNRKFTQCKKCLTMHVNNYDPQTYLWILQEADVPYVPDEWNSLMMKFGRDPAKTTGTTILGRYLAKMQLKQWRDFRWKDNEFLQTMVNKRIEETMKNQGYETAAIAAAIDENTFDIPEGELSQPDIYYEPQTPDVDGFLSPGDVNRDNEGAEFLDQITEEEYAYLRLKWGKTYRPEEWVALEQLYVEMVNTYDIQDAGDINTLKLVCKCSLKANQLLDLGDWA